MGYTNVEIFERYPCGGGISAIDLPQYRLQYDDVRAEVALAEGIGVKIHYDKELGRDFTVDSLKQDGYKAVFLGVGLSKPKLTGAFEGLTPEQGVWNSKDYLVKVAFGSKPGLGCGSGACSKSSTGLEGDNTAYHSVDNAGSLPKLSGHVMVLGVGDVAIDCATSAFRCGATQVTLAFRKGFNDARAIEEVFQWARDDRCEFIPFAEPNAVTMGSDGKIDALAMTRYELSPDGTYSVSGDINVKCDHVISAFGCETRPEEESSIRTDVS